MKDYKAFKIIVFNKTCSDMWYGELKKDEVYGVTVNPDNPLDYDLLYSPAERNKPGGYITRSLEKEHNLPKSTRIGDIPIRYTNIPKHQLREWYDNRTISIINPT